MPDAPVQIIANASGSTPSAPVQIAANGSGSTPSAPPVVSSATAALDPGVIIGGTLSPNVAGYLRLVQIDSGGRPVYGHPTGELPMANAATMVFYNGARWELLHYPAGTNEPGARWQASVGTQLSPNLASGWAPADGGILATGTPTFTLVTKATPVLRLAEDAAGLYPARIRVTGTLTRNGTTPLLFPPLFRAVDFNGRACWTETGEDWAGELAGNHAVYWDSEDLSWILFAATGVPAGFGGGADASPMTVDDWAPLGTETGTPVLTAAPANPEQITANGTGSSPASPVQITANGAAGTPTAPVQITGNGSGSTPTAPVQITGNGSGSTPTAPPVVVA